MFDVRWHSLIWTVSVYFVGKTNSQADHSATFEKLKNATAFLLNQFLWQLRMIWMCNIWNYFNMSGVYTIFTQYCAILPSKRVTWKFTVPRVQIGIWISKNVDESRGNSRNVSKYVAFYLITLKFWNPSVTFQSFSRIKKSLNAEIQSQKFLWN